MQKQRQGEPKGNERVIYRDYGQSMITYRLGHWIFGLYLPKSPRSGSYFVWERIYMGVMCACIKLSACLENGL